MGVVDVSHLSYRYGKLEALRDLELSVPEGALYALLGPNGSGKTTLLQILMGLRRADAGQVSIMGVASTALTLDQRRHISYVAEGQSLPEWMRLEQVESYLAPLYPTWDASLATDLRNRFGLDSRKTIRAMSRGERMKSALLCALAPRPKLLIMDEPFTGMDALVRDDLVRGLLESAGTEGWTVLLCSHDIGELELLADWVGFLDEGRMRLSAPMDVVKARYQHVEVVSPELGEVRDEWMSVERAGQRMSFLVSHTGPEPVATAMRAVFPSATRIDVREASLRELFVGLARRKVTP